MLKSVPNIMGSRKKLTDWKEEPSLEDLKNDLLSSDNAKKAYLAKLAVWEDHYEGKGVAAVKAMPNRSQIVTKLIRKHAEWRYPTLSEPFLSTSNIFDVSPVSWEDRKAAEQNALVLNNQFNTKINKVDFIDNYVRSLVDNGLAILRTSWIFEEKEVKEPVPVYEYIVDETVAEDLKEAAALEESDPNAFSALPPDLKESLLKSAEVQQPIRAVIKEYRTETVNKVVKNHPFVEVCDVRSVNIDPTCNGDIDKAAFVIYTYESSMSDLKRSGKYTNLDDVNIESASADSSEDFTPNNSSLNGFSFADAPRKKLVVHEYWGFYDIDGSGITQGIVATWVGSTMIGLAKNPFPDGLVPFVLVKYMPKRNDIYGEPDAELLIDNQKILGAVTRGVIDLMGRSANGQTGIAKNLLDSTNYSRFNNGQNYEFNPTMSPSTQIYTHEYPNIPQAAQFMLQQQNQEAESLTGVKAFGSSGLSASALGSATSSATSVRGVLDAASKREISILRRLVDGMMQVGKKFVSMNSLFLSDEEIIRVTNDKFVKITRDELAGNFDLTIDVSTAESEDAKANELAFLLQTMGANLDPEMSKLLLSRIAKLRKMPDLAQMLETFTPQPDPMAEEERKAAIRLTNAQAALYEAQAEEAMAKSILNSTKVATEQARADNLQANADSTYVKTSNESDGTSHSRGMESQMMKEKTKLELAQMVGESNMQKKLLEADLDPTNPFSSGSFDQGIPVDGEMPQEMQLPEELPPEIMQQI